MIFSVSLSREQCHLRCHDFLRLVVEEKPHSLKLTDWEAGPAPTMHLRFGCAKCDGEYFSISYRGAEQGDVGKWEMDDPHDTVTPQLAVYILDVLKLKMVK